MTETSLEVLLDLWVVLMGEDVLWLDASTAAQSNANIAPWFQILTQKDLLVTKQVDGQMRIFVTGRKPP